MVRLLLLNLVLLPLVICDDPPPPDLPRPRLVIAGMSGSGKSTLANVLLGEDPLCSNCTFSWCSGTDSCTKETTYAVGSWIGTGVEFTVVDTPGFGDSDGEDNANIEEMMNVLNNIIQSTNTILLLFKGDIGRFQEGLTNMVREMTMLFGESMWDHVIIGVSFWPYDQDSINDRNEFCGPNSHHPEMCHDESWLTAEINRQLQDKIHLTRNISSVFIDAWSQTENHIGDETEQKYFEQETAKLLEFMSTMDDFKFRTINDVLKENEQMKEEINCLNGVIQEDISDINAEVTIIKEDFDDMKIDIMHNRQLISNNMKTIAIQEEKIAIQENKIANNLMKITKNEDLITANVENIINTNEKIDSVEESLISMIQIELQNIRTQMAGMVLPPLGTITAWVPKPSSDASPISLPDGWVECNGQQITEGIWKNKRTPNLNEQGLFLRGGLDAHVLETEDDSVRDITVKDKHLHTYGCNGADVLGSINIGYGPFDDSYCSGTHKLSEWNSFMGAETRPKNMKVTYIMRIK